MSERKRGIICAYCCMAWGYDDESPTPELIKEACDHESICEKNPYTAQIRNLKQERDEALMDRANGDIATMTRNHYERILQEREEWKNKAYSHATDYTLMEAKCFRLEQQLKEYDQLKS